jgi:hypothetical protein
MTEEKVKQSWIAPPPINNADNLKQEEEENRKWTKKG